MVHGKKPSIHDLIMFGSIVTIVNPNKNILPKLSPDRAKQSYFLGYGNTVKNIVYWDPLKPETNHWYN